MLYQNVPENFNPKFTAVGCFVEYDGEILLLHRQDSEPQGNTWGLPSGKMDEGENPLEAILREIKEETGFEIPKSQISYFSKVYVRFPGLDYVYHLFHTRLNNQPKVQINPNEHKDSKWVHPKKALDMSLIQDLDACISLVYE